MIQRLTSKQLAHRCQKPNLSKRFPSCGSALSTWSSARSTTVITGPDRGPRRHRRLVRPTRAMADQPEGRLGTLARKTLLVAFGITIAAIGYLDLWQAGSERSIGEQLPASACAVRPCRRGVRLAIVETAQWRCAPQAAAVRRDLRSPWAPTDSSRRSMPLVSGRVRTTRPDSRPRTTPYQMKVLVMSRLAK